MNKRMKILTIIMFVFILIFSVMICVNTYNSKNNTVESKIAKLKTIKEYTTRIYYNDLTKEIYRYSDALYDKEEGVFLLGKDGVLFDNEKKIEEESEENNERVASKTYVRNNYTIKINGNNINVYYNDKVIVDGLIEYMLSGFESDTFKDKIEISDNMITILNGNLILRNTSYYYDYSDDDVKWSEAKTYLINESGIIKTYDGYLSSLITKIGKVNYLYNIKDNNEVVVYDTNFDEVYSFNTNSKEDLYYSCYNTNNENICKFNGNYIDLISKNAVDEKTAYYISLDNNCGFTLVNDKLNVYHNNNLIGEFNNMDSYLGGYYFSSEFTNNEKIILYELVIENR